jgi:hypothetical protein
LIRDRLAAARRDLGPSHRFGVGAATPGKLTCSVSIEDMTFSGEATGVAIRS